MYDSVVFTTQKLTIKGVRAAVIIMIINAKAIFFNLDFVLALTFELILDFPGSCVFSAILDLPDLFTFAVILDLTVNSSLYLCHTILNPLGILP